MQRKLGAALGVCLLLGTLVACTPGPIVGIPSSSLPANVPVLTVAAAASPDGVNAQEGPLVAHVYAAALQAAGFEAGVRATPDTAAQLLAGLETGSGDVAAGYSRDLLKALDPGSNEGDAANTMAALKKALPEGLALLDSAKSEDSDNLVVTAATAEKYQLKTIDDLAKVCGQLIFGGTAGFQDDGHGLAGLKSSYNCEPKKYLDLKPLNDGSKEDVLWSLLRDDIQVADIHASAPAIADNALVALEDSRKLFPGQNIVPVVATEKVPAAAQAVLNKVSAALTTDQLANLNRLSQDRHFGSQPEVAMAWLIQAGLVKAGT